MAVEGLISNTAQGAAGGSLVSPGLGTVIGAGTGLLSGLVSSYFNDKALSKQNKILSKEKKRQLALEKEQLAFQKEQTKFSQRMSSRQLGLSSRQLGLSAKAQEFQMGQTNRQNRVNDFQRMMDMIVKRIKTDNAVRDQFVQRGYI